MSKNLSSVAPFCTILFPLLICLILTDSRRKVFSSAFNVVSYKTFCKFSLRLLVLGFVIRRVLAYSLRLSVTPGFPLRWIPYRFFALLIAGNIDRITLSDKFVEVISTWINLRAVRKKWNK